MWQKAYRYWKRENRNSGWSVLRFVAEYFLATLSARNTVLLGLAGFLANRLGEVPIVCNDENSLRASMSAARDSRSR